MPAASGVTVSVMFDGTWEDVTNDFDFATGYTVKLGRSRPGDQPQASNCTVRLWNSLGQYTPGVLTLADGSSNTLTAPGTMLKVETDAGVDFIGNISQWSPQYDNGIAGYVTVNAVDALDRLSRVTLTGPLRVVMNAQMNSFSGSENCQYWPMDDSSSGCSEQSGFNRPPLSVLEQAQEALSFSSGQLPSGEPSVVQFNPGAYNSGQYLGGVLRVPFYFAGSGSSVQCVFNAGGTPTWGASHATGILAVSTIDLSGDAHYTSLTISDDGTLELRDSTAGAAITGPIVTDNEWHHVLIDFYTGTLTLFVDGEVVGSDSYSSDLILRGSITVGAAPQSDVRNSTDTAARFKGSIGHVLAGPSHMLATYTDPYNSLFGWVGETVDQRLNRWLDFADFTDPRDLDASTLTLDSYPETGKTVAAACQDIVASEGGGAVFYINAGTATYRSKEFRNPAHGIGLEIDAVADADRSVYQPAVDFTTLVNTVTASAANASGQLGEVTATDTNSVSAYGTYTGSAVTSYGKGRFDSLDLAQWYVAANANPQMRMPQLGIDLLTSVNDLWADVQATQIGSRIRESNLPIASGPASQRDSYVEGWTKTISIGNQAIVYDTSSADAPPDMVCDDQLYGRAAESDGALTLNASFADSDTTIVLDLAVGTLTTAARDYAMWIRLAGPSVGQPGEIIQLPDPPSGSGPYTFTGCVRGEFGTFPLATVSAGTAVSIYSPAAPTI